MAPKRTLRCLLNGVEKTKWIEKLKHDFEQTIVQLSNEENYTGKVIGLHVSYQTFLRFFANKHMSLSIEDLILAAHFSYVNRH
ncbi:MAG: hypothetical protein R3271_11385 [Methylophaga sp.]|uniref:hypothetical protein n=1 Tax=Methylophaga sp. TaxID=2024840 RepID=UPI00299F4C71|nr:hypothetical protein [Methylophaga sp.]MDX1750912.1 hypothetical protein [Methylophaga sp.]